jgi:hypothetical protein
MKKHNLKNMTATLFFTLAFLVCSTVSTAKAIENTITKTDATLTSRYTGGTFATASYSFKTSSQDIEITKNNMEVLFEAREDFKDFFSVSMAVDDISVIYDLGDTSCKEINSTKPQLRTKKPLEWLASSDANPANLFPTLIAEVKKGHCYLTVNKDDSGRVVALFHVADHNKSFSVRINEIEVLEKTNSYK